MIDGSPSSAGESPEEPTVPEGRRLQDGRYRLLQRLGTGGFGTVWKAHDTEIRRLVAIKEITRPHEDVGVGADGRLAVEVRALAAAECPSVVRVYDTFREGNGRFLVMEFIDGPTLGERLRSGPMPPVDVARMGLQLLDALDAAHRNGVLHRDVKPANIMLRGDRALLTDFGIAHIGAHTPQTGFPTLGYGAPEVVGPRDPKPYTEASDLWALGAVLHEAVTARQAYPMYSVLVGGDPSERHTPALRAGALTPVIEGLLCDEPGRRWTAARARDGLSRALGELADGTSHKPESPEGVEPTPRRPEPAERRSGIRRARPYLLVTALLVLLGTLAALQPWKPEDTGTRVPRDWLRRTPHSLLGPIDATLSVPPGFAERPQVPESNDTWPEAKYVRAPFLIQLRKQVGIRGTAADEADKTINGYRARGRADYGGPEERISAVEASPVAETRYRGRAAAVADIRYTDRGGKSWRLLELFVVNRDADCYRLQVAMPPTAPQADRGQEIFDGVRASLDLGGFDK
ncbi:protein kinase [Streptomyces sp. NPDC058861]|uniref:protein kinase domain-containing protein n=1 Tax=Streptomyces sp. NPDC058861 TaxID=3346653 RepID=UPI0036AAC4FF